MSSSARKHARYMVEIDNHLRSITPPGTRTHVRYDELLSAVHVHKANASGALAALARIDGAGYTRIAGGEYEYMMPTFYPQELQDIKNTMREPGKRRPPRGQLTAEVLRWLYEQEEEMLVTPMHLAEILDANANSVSGVLRRIADDKSTTLLTKTDVGQAVYKLTPTGHQNMPDPNVPVYVPQNDPGNFHYKDPIHDRGQQSSHAAQTPDSGPVLLIDDLSGLQQGLMAKAAEIALAPPKPTSMPKTQPPRDTMYRQKYITKSGKIVVESCLDNTLYYLKELD